MHSNGLEAHPHIHQYIHDLSKIMDFFRSRCGVSNIYDVDLVDFPLDAIHSEVNSGNEFVIKYILDVIFSSYLAGYVFVAERISSVLNDIDIYRDQLRQAQDLGRKGEMIKAAYVARGHALYNQKFAEGFFQVVPPVVQNEVAALPPTARMLDLGCGTGLVGGLCRSQGYNGYMAGLDLVAEMVAGVPPNTYDRTISADAEDWLAANTEKWDAVLSFGVFVHFDFHTAERMIALISGRLKDGGFLAFNAAESRSLFGHALPLHELAPILARAGLDLEAMVRREERTTFICRKG